KAVVYGGAQRVTRVTVDAEVGEWVDMPFDGKIVEGQVEVTNQAGDVDYSRGDDYELQHTAEDGVPKIRALSDGDISNGETIRFAGDVKPRGEYTNPDVEGEEYPKTEITDIPGLASAQMCEQVAMYLVEQTGEAVIEATVTLPTDSVPWNVVEAIDPSELPGEGPYQLRDMDSDAASVSISMGRGESAGEIIDEIEDRTSRNSERV
ncbi:hypothetical protein ACFF2X_43150, partial [Cryptosporangium minutisporangium]